MLCDTAAESRQLQLCQALVIITSCVHALHRARKKKKEQEEKIKELAGIEPAT
jgi:hypothetical protein